MTQDDKDKQTAQPPSQAPKSAHEKMIITVVRVVIAVGIVWAICHFYPAKINRLLHLFGF